MNDILLSSRGYETREIDPLWTLIDVALQYSLQATRHMGGYADFIQRDPRAKMRGAKHYKGLNAKEAGEELDWGQMYQIAVVKGKRVGCVIRM